MDWIRVSELPHSVDLSPIVALLREREVDFRIIEEGDRQVVLASNPASVEPLRELLRRHQAGELDLSGSAVGEESDPPTRSSHLLVSPRRTPGTLVLLALSALGALLVATEPGQRLASWLTFTPWMWVDGSPGFGSLSDALSSGQWWRLLTPIFLHFGIFHILFNGVWLWELGRRLELDMGWQRYFLFVAFAGVASNLSQYVWSGAGLFGGMSGVIYALVGFVWLRQRLAPSRLYAVSPGLIGFMLVWLVLCMTGVVDQFIEGSIANAAHVGGLVVGMALGAYAGNRAREGRAV